MGTSKKQRKLYSFYKAVVTVTGFAACFYLLIVCFAGTYRLISDIGYARVMFLNPLLLLFVAVDPVFHYLHAICFRFYLKYLNRTD